MTFTPIEIDRENLTLMGVSFPDLKTLNNVASGVGTNMFEGFKPTARDIEIIRDFCSDKITIEQLVQISKQEFYAEQI